LHDGSQFLFLLLDNSSDTNHKVEHQSSKEPYRSLFSNNVNSQNLRVGKIQNFGFVVDRHTLLGSKVLHDSFVNCILSWGKNSWANLDFNTMRELLGLVDLDYVRNVVHISQPIQLDIKEHSRLCCVEVVVQEHINVVRGSKRANTGLRYWRVVILPNYFHNIVNVNGIIG